jgi:hypothetical protein
MIEFFFSQKENFKYEKIIEEVETTGVLHPKRTIDVDLYNFF